MADNKQDLGATWREEWASAQKIKGPTMQNSSVFYRNIEEELDLSRQVGLAFPLHTPSHVVDFSSLDVLGMGATGILREEFMRELEANPGVQIGAGGSRLLDGSSPYQAMFEKELAELMGVESALMVHSGWTANQAIFSTVPRSGDAIVYDELMHATALSGMKVSLALDQRPFRHNDVDHFIEVMEAVKEASPLIKAGKRCVIVGVESYYSMDGDICPLKELIEAAKEIFPQGNAQFVVDEAHSFAVCGPEGLGFVRELGLDDEVAIKMVTFGKALSGSGAMILSNNTIRSLLTNQAKVFICSVAPPFTLLAACRAGLRLSRTPLVQEARDRLRELTLLYLDTLTSHPVYKKAHKKGLVDMPVHEDGSWHEIPITHIVPLWTPRPKHALYLSLHLTRDGINGCNIVFPIVGKGEDRVRLLIHAHNTKDDVMKLVNSITTWATEMLEIEASGDKNRLPGAARLAFDLIWRDRQASNGTNGAATINGVEMADLLSGSNVIHKAPLVSGVGRLGAAPVGITAEV
ncbi:putative aminotransferase class I and II [Colletotrichum karsti]|uniref:Aminotransferase class I and II n=1 Tax=Colletotrichum karsti TaxID=1095194 RepID=A0A9P6IIY4_9PEZI|nr:putative aminotransferase class I and II [Colletotrichum karsti]KAF9880615.1 putative aminotransferase class I and II [Colletotrichum karsti]